MMKHFTYKITFPGMPWFYYGVHTDNGRPYFGSPKTHKWIWIFYEHEIQILEWFENRREAEQVEDRLIKHFIDDPHCLNEHYGGHWTEEARTKGRNKVNKNKSDKQKEAWEKVVKNNIESGRQSEFGRLGGLALRGVPKNFSEEERQKRAKAISKVRTPEGIKKGGVNANKVKYRCLVTGHISTACGLANYQRARGIDTNLREVYSPSDLL